MDIIKYISDLPRVTRGKLLQQSHCCLAIYRGLTDRERILCCRLLASPWHYLGLLKDLSDGSSSIKPEDQVILEPEPEVDAEQGTLSVGDSANSSAPSPTSKVTDPRIVVQKLLPSLWQLGVLELKDGMIWLEDGFADQLYASLSGPNAALEEVLLPEMMEDLSKPALVEFAKLKWEQLLKPLLNLARPNGGAPPSRNHVSNSDQMARVLRKSGLVSNTEPMRLLPDGYTFLLSEIPRQIWTLAHSFLSKEVSLSHRADGISFLILLATSLAPGTIYSTSSLSDVQRQLLSDWETFGIVKFISSSPEPDFKPSSRKGSASPSESHATFTVTPLASAIVETSGSTVRIGEWSSGIIVESNFYVYCYTNSAIMIGLLELFAHISVRLPNMCVARLTRQSVRSAFKKGIHASHIIQYLQANKHAAYHALQATKASSSANSRNSALALAQTLSTGSDNFTMETMFPTSKASGLPEQVEDQLKLWEEERFRFSSEQVIHWAFESGIDDPTWFDQVKQYAVDIGALVWSDDKTKSLAVKPTAQDPIAAFYRTLQASFSVK